MKHLHTFESFVNESQDLVTFSINDEKLDQILHNFHKRELDYVDIKGDEYYTLPRKSFDRFIDTADSNGFDVDYEHSEDSDIYVMESSLKMNEANPLFKKEGNAEISVKTSESDKLESILKMMQLDFVNLGKKDSSQLTFYKILDTNWDAMNKVGEKVKLQSMTILED